MVLALHSGCGRVGFEPAPPDAADGCWASWRAGSPAVIDVTPVASINGAANAKNPFLMSDGTTLYFASDRPGGFGGSDFWRAVRPTPTDAFGPAEHVASLSTSSDEGRVELTADGRSGVLSSNRPGGAGSYDLWGIERNAAGSATEFTVSETGMAALETAGADKDAHLVDSGRRIYYSVDQTRLLVSERDATNTYSAGVPIAGLENLAMPADPVPSPDERVIVFSLGAPTSDLYVATRSSVDEPFGAPAPIASVNTPRNEQDVFVTADGCELWFATSANGPFEIVVARIAP
jgi:hypothetical protein